MNAWLWSKAEISPGWKPLSDLAFVLTCCTHLLPLLPCGLSLSLSHCLSLACSYTHTRFSILLLPPQPPSLSFERTIFLPYFCFYLFIQSTLPLSFVACWNVFFILAKALAVHLSSSVMVSLCFVLLSIEFFSLCSSFCSYINTVAIAGICHAPLLLYHFLSATIVILPFVFVLFFCINTMLVQHT